MTPSAWPPAPQPKWRPRYQTAQAKRTPGLEGFNNDGYSETYAGDCQLTWLPNSRPDMAAAVDLYLPRSHPLRYAGGDPVCRVVTRP